MESIEVTWFASLHDQHVFHSHTSVATAIEPWLNRINLIQKQLAAAIVPAVSAHALPSRSRALCRVVRSGSQSFGRARCCSHVRSSFAKPLDVPHARCCRLAIAALRHVWLRTLLCAFAPLRRLVGHAPPFVCNRRCSDWFHRVGTGLR